LSLVGGPELLHPARPATKKTAKRQKEAAATCKKKHEGHRFLNEARGGDRHGLPFV
jgi:hypothetical protein